MDRVPLAFAKRFSDVDVSKTRISRDDICSSYEEAPPLLSLFSSPR